MTLTCPDCAASHDVRACAEEGGTCDCCATLFAGYDERDAALEAVGST